MFQARRGSDMVIWGVFIQQLFLESVYLLYRGKLVGVCTEIVLEKLLLVVQEAKVS